MKQPNSKVQFFFHYILICSLNNRQCSNDSSVDFEDDGDYATLRMGAAAAICREDTLSEENKVRGDGITVCRAFN